MQKKNAGFSYVEVLAASALFVIVLLVALTLTLGVGQNLTFARQNRSLSLAANSLSLAVRDMVLSETQISSDIIRNLAGGLGIENYCVFIFMPNGSFSHGSPFQSCETNKIAAFSGFGTLAGSRDGRLVYVIVRNDYNKEVGRSLSLAIDFDNKSGIWRNAGG